MANTFGSDYDTTLSVYSGSPGALDLIACNDDADGMQSQMVFDAAAGTTYYLMVGAFSSGPGGNLTLFVDVAPPPLEIHIQVNSSGRVVPKTGMVTLTGTITCSRQAFVDIFSSIQQRSGRATIGGFGFAQVDCNGATSWRFIRNFRESSRAGLTVMRFRHRPNPQDHGSCGRAQLEYNDLRR